LNVSEGFWDFVQDQIDQYRKATGTKPTAEQVLRNLVSSGKPSLVPKSEQKSEGYPYAESGRMAHGMLEAVLADGNPDRIQMVTSAIEVAFGQLTPAARRRSGKSS
jgi:hypothetical protein